MLDGVGSVNDFTYVDVVEFTQGDQVDVYFQLIDASKDKALQQFKPAGRRFMPAAGATLQVTLDNIDDDKKVTRAASQPFAGDPSIWKVSVLSTDVIRGTINLVLVLTESGKVTRGRAEAAISIDSQDLV
jgi:hypothetical protein